MHLVCVCDLAKLFQNYHLLYAYCLIATRFGMITMLPIFCLLCGTYHLFYVLTVAVDCGRLDSPSNGRVVMQPTPDSTTLNSIASYFCDEGFILLGAPVRACLQNGVWSGIAPTCMGKLDNTAPRSRNRKCYQNYTYSIVMAL